MHALLALATESRFDAVFGGTIKVRAIPRRPGRPVVRRGKCPETNLSERWREGQVFTSLCYESSFKLQAVPRFITAHSSTSSSRVQRERTQAERALGKQLRQPFCPLLGPPVRRLVLRAIFTFTLPALHLARLAFVFLVAPLRN